MKISSVECECGEGNTAHHCFALFNLSKIVPVNQNSASYIRNTFYEVALCIVEIFFFFKHKQEIKVL